MRIELFGLCGSGKSYLTQEIIRLYPSIGLQLPVQPKGYNVYYEAIKIICKTRCYIPWLTTKLAYRIAGLKKRSLNGISLMVDSGVLQPIVSTVQEQFEEQNLKGLESFVQRFLDILPLPDMAVYIRTIPFTTFQRYNARENNSNLDLQGFTNANQICWEMANRLPIPVQEIDNEDEGISERKREAIHNIVSMAQTINSAKMLSAKKIQKR